MDATPQSSQVIQSQRPGDQRQQPEHQYEVLTLDGRVCWYCGGQIAVAVYCVAGCGGAVLG